MPHKTFKFEVKAEGEDAGRFTGRASVYGVVDSYNDVVMPGCFADFLAANGPRIKVLSQHDPSNAIGIAELSDTDTALLANGQLVLDLASARDEYIRLKNGLIDGISIGYDVAPGGASFDADGIRRLHKLNLWEISLVTFPANTFARVTDVKHGVKFVSNLQTAMQYLATAIARHQRHMDGSEVTDEASQRQMMDEMMAAAMAIDNEFGDGGTGMGQMAALLAEIKTGRKASSAEIARVKHVLSLAQDILATVESPAADESSASLKALITTVKDLRGFVAAHQ